MYSQYMEWDSHNWGKAFNFWQKKSNIELDSASVLEIGGRSGGLSQWFSERCLEVICSDLGGVSKEAIIMRNKYKIKNLYFEDIDALNINYKEKFDLIVFKSVLGGVGRNNSIKNQKLMMSEIYKALKPSGEVWFAEIALLHQCIHFVGSILLLGEKVGVTYHFLSCLKSVHYIEISAIVQLDF